MVLLGRYLPAGICCAAFLLWPAPAAFAATAGAADGLSFRAIESVDNAELMRELTLTRNDAGRLTMTMWLPDEFWRVVFAHRGAMTDRGINDYIAIVHPYTLVAVLDGQIGIAAYRYTDVESLANEVTIEDAHGERYGPLPQDAIAEDVRNMIQMFRPLLSNTMGAMGQHMEFLVFPSADKGGHPLADPKSSGSLIVHVGEVSMRYRLPLGSLLVPSVDRKTGESFPGSYRFNPFSGDKLVPQPTPPPVPAAPAGSAPKTQ